MPAIPFAPALTASTNMVSCRGWGDLAEWSKAFVAALERAAVPAQLRSPVRRPACSSGAQRGRQGVATVLEDGLAMGDEHAFDR